MTPALEEQTAPHWCGIPVGSIELELAGKRRHPLPLIIDVTYAVACQSFEVGLLEKVGIADLHSEVPLIGWKLGKKRIQIVDKVPSVFVIPRVKVRELEYEEACFFTV